MLEFTVFKLATVTSLYSTCSSREREGECATRYPDSDFMSMRTFNDNKLQKFLKPVPSSHWFPDRRQTDHSQNHTCSYNHTCCCSRQCYICGSRSNMSGSRDVRMCEVAWAENRKTGKTDRSGWERRIHLQYVCYDSANLAFGSQIYFSYCPWNTVMRLNPSKSHRSALFWTVRVSRLNALLHPSCILPLRR